jgi:hypothetical protein
MDSKLTKTIFDDASSYEEHFKEDIAKLQKMSDELSAYQDICEKRITLLSSDDNPSQRGRDKYITDLAASLVAIVAEKHALEEDTIKIRQEAVNYALKNNNGNDNSDTSELLRLFLKMQKSETRNSEVVKSINDTLSAAPKSASDLDSEIDKRIGGNV